MSTDPHELIRRRAQRAARRINGTDYNDDEFVQRDADEIVQEFLPLADVVMLLQRLRQWDYMNTPSSDGPYWKGEIDAALAKLVVEPVREGAGKE